MQATSIPAANCRGRYRFALMEHGMSPAHLHLYVSPQYYTAATWNSRAVKN
jgi:hypothetical protein